MRKVLAVITAILLAAIVFAPAMGYTIAPGAKPAFSGQSEKVNYTIGSGTPAHEMVYNEEMAEYLPIYSIGSTALPYSFKLGTTNTVVALGKGLVAPAETENATEQATQPALPTTEAVDVTEVANVTNQTAAVTPAPVEVVKLAIMGMVKDENETGLAGWIINLEQPAGTIIANTTTSENGSYSFPGLDAGAYDVIEVLPADWTAVTPADGKASVELVDQDVTVDFANMMIPAPVMPAGNETNTTGLQ
jgi:hypothetical protein